MLRVAGTLSKSTEVMKQVNTIIKAPELQKTMMEMSKGKSGREGVCGVVRDD